VNPIAAWGAKRVGLARWALVYEAAKWIYEHGRKRWEKYTPEERRRLGELVRKSKGRRANLNEGERGELWELVKKAV
jgi:hypothetical protein